MLSCFAMVLNATSKSIHYLIKKPSKIDLMACVKYLECIYRNKSITNEGKIPITTFNAIAIIPTA